MKFGILILILGISVHAASAAPVISVDPTNIQVLEGESFTVNIMVDPGDVEIMGVQYQLHFDNTLLSAVDQSKGAFLSHDGGSTIPLVNNVNNTVGIIEYGEMRTIDYGVTTSGILATIKFNATKHGVCSLTLRDVVMSDQNSDEIPDVSSNDGRCTITSKTGTPAPTAIEPPSSGIPIPTPTGSPTAAPTEPAATPTATAVGTAAADQTPPTEPQSTASSSATLKQTVKRPSDKSISGFTSILAMIGILIALYAISKGKR